MRAADKAWLVLCAGIIAYEAVAIEGELLSEGYDRYIATEHAAKRLLAMAVPWVIAAHLTNTFPNEVDPISLGFRAMRRLRRGL